MNRHEFLKNITLGTTVSFLLPSLTFCESGNSINTGAASNTINQNFTPDLDVELTATQTSLQLLDGNKTQVYTYQSEVLKNEGASVETLQDSYLGPVFRVKQDQKIRIRFKNQLPRESIIHWHGLHIPPEMDGHPMHAVGNGNQYIYEFEVRNRPGTYWFHPHPDKITGPQVYQGLAGLFIVEENIEADASDEIPLIIQDRTFDADNRFVYLQGSPMSQMQGFLGNRILVNGSADKTFQISRNGYRFRLLNGSNSRIYKLAWSDGSPVNVIGTDGGLLPQPQNKPYLMLAPGERAEVWKDFSAARENDEVVLQSLPFNDGTSMGMGGGMMGGGMSRGGMMDGDMMSGSGLANGIAFDICTFKITGSAASQNSMPAGSQIPKMQPADAVNNKSPRKFHFYNERMQWVINGETFEMTEAAEWEQVKLNTTEIWEFINGDGGGRGMMQDMMRLPHPVHIHGLQFQITDRNTTEMDPEVWDSVKDGFIDDGWQDTFLLMPGMKVRIILRFEDFTGLYVYHCHNLEHEDMGMMRNYEIM